MLFSRIAVALLGAAALTGCQKETKTETSEPAAAAAPAAPGAAATPIAVPDVKYSTATADINKGKDLFAEKGCTACHKIGGGKLVGPDLKGVTARRSPTWIAKMILRPDVMIKEDETAKDLFRTHLTPMPNQGVNPDSELQAIMSYLRSNES